MKKVSSFEIASQMLNEVIFNNLTFSSCLKIYSQKYNLHKEEFSLASVLCGCELRHHLLFSELIDIEFGELPKECLIAFALVLANGVFIKRIDEEEANLFLLKTLLANELHFNKEKLDSFFANIFNSEHLIPNKYSKESIDFLSLRYNTPKWLVKTWQKNFKNLTYKILKANTKQPLNTVRLNPLLDTQVVKEDSIFEKTFADEMLAYKGKAPIKKQTHYINGLIFPMKMSVKHVFENITLDSLKGIAVYQGYPNNAYLEAIFNTSKHADIDIIVTSHQDYHEAKVNIARFGLDKARLYRSEASSIITCVSRKVDSFIVCPRSSNFDLLRSAPDYFLRFNPETFDSLIKEQTESLKECSNFVEEGGQLIYLVPTISLKEGQLLIRKFLESNKDFELESERQYFPFDPYDSCLYFALLRKKVQ